MEIEKEIKKLEKMKKKEEMQVEVARDDDQERSRTISILRSRMKDERDREWDSFTLHKPSQQE